MSNNARIEKMYTLSRRLNKIVAEMQHRKELIEKGMHQQAA
ncbi:hypothetical protein [Aeromonas encheleia]|nr:hypothetical protein [Aeromonas encheleia]